jgi:hypothetical protein
MKDIGSDIAYIIVMLMIIAGFLKVPKTGRLNQPRRE